MYEWLVYEVFTSLFFVFVFESLLGIVDFYTSDRCRGAKVTSTSGDTRDNGCSMQRMRAQMIHSDVIAANSNRANVCHRMERHARWLTKTYSIANTRVTGSSACGVMLVMYGEWAILTASELEKKSMAPKEIYCTQNIQNAYDLSFIHGLGVDYSSIERVGRRKIYIFQDSSSVQFYSASRRCVHYNRLCRTTYSTLYPCGNAE